MKFARNLNEAGQKHVAEELDRLNLSWDVDATCSDIEQKISFSDLEQGGSMEYEISNTQAGKRSYGVHGYIEILADEHVNFEDSEED